MAVAVSVGSVRFQELLAPAYTSRYLQAPSGVVGVTYRDFNVAPVPSGAVPFVCLASVCRLFSA